jgi:hypothetical protein
VIDAEAKERVREVEGPAIAGGSRGGTRSQAALEDAQAECRNIAEGLSLGVRFTGVFSRSDDREQEEQPMHPGLKKWRAIKDKTVAPFNFESRKVRQLFKCSHGALKPH